MIGQKFGRLIVLSEGDVHTSPNGTRFRRVICRCECGKEKLIRTNNLRNGTTRSCGCLQRETIKALGIERGHVRRSLARNMRIIVDGFLGWTTEFLNFIPVSDTYTLVDEEDFAKLSRMNWHLISTPKSDRYYAYAKAETGERGGKYLMHRLIVSPPKGFDVDHRNRNGLDNRRENLRPASRSQNMANQRIRKTNKTFSVYKGVSKREQGWIAQLRRRGRHYHLGYFATEEEAATAYNRAAKELFGEFALTNKISSLAAQTKISNPEGGTP